MITNYLFSGAFTPVLDIKPYIPSVDVVKSRKNREAEYLFRTLYGKRIKDSDRYK